MMALGRVPRAAASTGAAAVPWYRQVTADRRKAFLGAYLGWLLDGFDFSILTLVLVDVQRSFTLNSALAGALGGMGGVWSAGMPLAIEHWPPHLRGVASGLLQGGYAMGFILTSTRCRRR